MSNVKSLLVPALALICALVVIDQVSQVEAEMLTNVFNPCDHCKSEKDQGSFLSGISLKKIYCKLILHCRKDESGKGLSGGSSGGASGNEKGGEKGGDKGVPPTPMPMTGGQGGQGGSQGGQGGQGGGKEKEEEKKKEMEKMMKEKKDDKKDEMKDMLGNKQDGNKKDDVSNKLGHLKEKASEMKPAN